MISASRFMGVLAGECFCVWVYPIVNPMRPPRIIMLGPHTQ